MDVHVDDADIQTLLDEGIVVRFDNRLILNAAMFRKKVQQKKKKQKTREIKYDEVTSKFVGLTLEDLSAWSKVFSFDVEREINKMELWLKDNQSKRYINYGKFIFKWLNRTEKDLNNVLQFQQPRIIREY